MAPTRFTVNALVLEETPSLTEIVKLSVGVVPAASGFSNAALGR